MPFDLWVQTQEDQCTIMQMYGCKMIFAVTSIFDISTMIQELLKYHSTKFSRKRMQMCALRSVCECKLKWNLKWASHDKIWQVFQTSLTDKTSKTICQKLPLPEPWLCHSSGGSFAITVHIFSIVCHAYILRDNIIHSFHSNVSDAFYLD